MRIRPFVAVALVAFLVASPARAQAVSAVDEVVRPAEGEDLTFWQSLVNVLTAPFRFLGAIFYYGFKFLFYDVWVALFEWIFGSSEFDQAVDSLLAPDPGTREAAARRLGELDDERAVDPLLARLADPHPGVRRQSVQALGEIGGERAVAGIVGALADPDPFVRGQAALALGRAGSADRDLPRLLAILDGPGPGPEVHWFVESSALTAVGALGGPAEAPRIRPYLDRRDQGEDAVVLASAVHALGRLRDEPSRPRFLELVRSDDPFVRSAAAAALGMIGAVDDLRRLLAESTEPATIRVVLLALGGYGSPADAERVLLFTRHPDTQVAASALTALGALRDPRAVDEAIGILATGSAYLRILAASLLARWTGEEFGPSAELWREWWRENSDSFEFETSE